MRTRGRFAVLFSTPIMSEAERLCNRLYLLHAGYIRESGTLTEILSRTQMDQLTEIFLQYARQPAADPASQPV